MHDVTTFLALCLFAENKCKTHKDKDKLLSRCSGLFSRHLNEEVAPPHPVTPRPFHLPASSHYLCLYFFGRDASGNGVHKAFVELPAEGATLAVCHVCEPQGVCVLFSPSALSHAFMHASTTQETLNHTKPLTHYSPSTTSTTSTHTHTHEHTMENQALASHIDLFPGIDFSFRVPFPPEVVTEEPFPHSSSTNPRRSKSAGTRPHRTCRRSTTSGGTHSPRRLAQSLPPNSTRRPSPLSQSRTHAPLFLNALSPDPHGAAVDTASPPAQHEHEHHNYHHNHHHAEAREPRAQEEHWESTDSEEDIGFSSEAEDYDDNDDGFVEEHADGRHEAQHEAWVHGNERGQACSSDDGADADEDDKQPHHLTRR